MTASDGPEPEPASLAPCSPTPGSNDQKKKKKKKKKPAVAVPLPAPRKPDALPVLCISRNKHWKYISSYHGPWLQLPLELLESLLVLNIQPATLANQKSPAQSLLASRIANPPRARAPRTREPDRETPPDPPCRHQHALSSYSAPANPHIWPVPGKPTPPPIDPGVFRNVATIRRLIDEAAELSVRASSGLSSAALGSIRAAHGTWSSAQSLGLDGPGTMGGGRNFAMSAMRVHRLRALAVQKLAAAYKADEIASSVMVMQGGSVFEDIAERVLRHDPNDPDAKYVHFFHEKIPSRANRQLAESTTTQVLDELIAVHPQRLEYYRTRGIVHSFRDEYALATKDFTYALKEARAARKGRTAHRSITLPPEAKGKSGKKKKAAKRITAQASPAATSDSVDASALDGPDGDPPVHPSVSPDAPDPIEPQLLFLRGATYLHHALHLIESAILRLEGVARTGSTSDGTEMRLCYLANSRYGGVEIGNPDGPLGKSDGPKARAYRDVLAEQSFRDDISSYLRKCIRDHERFLTHFDSLEGPPPVSGAPPTNLARKVEIAFLLSEMPRSPNQTGSSHTMDYHLPPMFTTYHPLLVESHFTILLCQLMLADFSTLLTTFAHAAVLVDALEGYPVFLPPRSMAQAEFVEVLERLAAGWRTGVQPHAAMRAAARVRAIEAPPVSPSDSLLEVMSSSSGDADSTRVPTPSSSSSSSPGLHATKGAPAPAPTCDIPSSAPSPIRAGATRADLAHVLDCARILLAPIAARQQERASKAGAGKAVDKPPASSPTASGKKKPLNINIPLHGPRVEIILAWLGAVHLVELEST